MAQRLHSQNYEAATERKLGTCHLHGPTKYHDQIITTIRKGYKIQKKPVERMVQQNAFDVTVGVPIQRLGDCRAETTCSSHVHLKNEL